MTNMNRVPLRISLKMTILQYYWIIITRVRFGVVSRESKRSRMKISCFRMYEIVDYAESDATVTVSTRGFYHRMSVPCRNVLIYMCINAVRIMTKSNSLRDFAYVKRDCRDSFFFDTYNNYYRQNINVI